MGESQSKGDHVPNLTAQRTMIGWEGLPGWLIFLDGRLLLTLQERSDGHLFNLGGDAEPWGSCGRRWACFEDMRREVGAVARVWLEVVERDRQAQDAQRAGPVATGPAPVRTTKRGRKVGPPAAEG